MQDLSFLKLGMWKGGRSNWELCVGSQARSELLSLMPEFHKYCFVRVQGWLLDRDLKPKHFQGVTLSTMALMYT
eukprot:scaffold296246_cov15-Tisochrysis_lutea.AAC.1